MNDYKNRKGQSVALQWVSILLQYVNVDILRGGDLTRTILKGSTSHSGNTDYKALRIGCLYAVNFLLPLGIEVGLKALILNENKIPKKTHDLIKLHNQLNIATQQKIATELKKIQTNDNVSLIKVLKSHRNDFERWRYLDNPSLIKREEILLQYVMSAILNVAG